MEEIKKAIAEIKSWTPVLLGMGNRCTDETSKAQDMAIKALEKQNKMLESLRTIRSALFDLGLTREQFIKIIGVVDNEMVNYW